MIEYVDNLFLLSKSIAMMTSQLLLIHRQKIHHVSPTLKGHKYELYVMIFYVPSKWPGIVDSLQAIILVQVHLD
jgi:hypothetical protein